MIPFAFFGSSRFSVIVLDALEKKGILPTLIITTPDKPAGRKLILTPTPVKTWGLTRNIPVLDPAKLDAAFVNVLQSKNIALFVVASYGKIIPKALLDLPAHKTLNIHPSLLPLYRGASPLQSAMLDDAKDTGVTIMRIDEHMDHGPLVAQKSVHIDEWPVYEEFETLMAAEGADLLAEIMPKWVSGDIREKDQEHDKATYTKKIEKEDGLLDLSSNTDPYKVFRMIQAYHEWPVAYLFIKHAGKDMRIKITSASFAQGTLTLEKVIPEGGKEMTYKDFVSGYGPLPGF